MSLTAFVLLGCAVASFAAPAPAPRLAPYTAPSPGPSTNGAGEACRQRDPKPAAAVTKKPGTLFKRIVCTPAR